MAYIVAHWRGQLSISRSILIGLASGVALVLLVIFAGFSVRYSYVPLAVVLIVFYVWLGWYLVGLVRLVINTILSPRKTFGQIVGITIISAAITGFGFVLAHDLSRLFHLTSDQ